MKQTLTLTITIVALFLTLAGAGMAQETATQQPMPDTRTAKEREQDDAAERWRVQERERLRKEREARAAGVTSATPNPTTPGFIDRDELERQVEEDQRRLQEQINRTGSQPQPKTPGVIQTPPRRSVPQQPNYNNGAESYPIIIDNSNESQRLEQERRQREWDAEEARMIEHEQKILPYIIVVLAIGFLVVIVGAVKYPKSGIRKGAIITASGAAVFVLLTYGRSNLFIPRNNTALDIVFIFAWLASLFTTSIGLSKVTSNLCTIPKSKSVRFLLVAIVSIGFIVAGAWLVGETRRGSPLFLLSIIVIAAGIIALIAGLIKAAGGSSTAGESEDAYHGSARFATESEIKQLTIKRGQVIEPGSFILAPAEREKGRNGQVVLPRMQTTQHGLILGGTGTGKSRGYFLPNCAQAVDTSLVVTDPKSELWKLTSGFQQGALRYAPADPDASEGFNWIPLCNDARMAELCARAIMQSGNTSQTDQFFIDTESAFLAALFAHASTMKEATPLTAYRLFTRQTPDDLIKQLLESPSETAREQAVIFMQTDPRYKGAIVPAVAARLQFMRDKAVQRFTSATLDAPDFGRLRREPTAIYWCLREQDIVRLRPLTSLFFTVLLEQLAGEQSETAEGVPVTMMLDEFANIGTIPDFETTISLARGRGVALWLGVQSLSQLDKAYGHANAQTIITNCLTKIALHALDYNTAKYISDMLGESTIVAKRHGFSFSPTGLVSVNRHGTEHRKMLMTPDEVMRLSETEAIVRTGNKYPMKLKKGYYDEKANTAPASALGEAITKDFPPLVMAGSTAATDELDIL